MKKLQDIVSFRGENNEPRKEGNGSTRPSKKSTGIFVKIAIGFGTVLVILAGLTFWSTLTLKVQTTLEDFSLTQSATIDSKATETNLANNILPGKFFESQAEKQMSFQTTGVSAEEKKAGGEIAVYNDMNPPSPVSLIANTRFLSAVGEKTFKTTKKIVVPAGKLEGGKVTPGSIKVEVVAQEGGEDYNIAPSKFSVPGLSGSELYYHIWADSSNSMAGGWRKEVKKISDDDLKKAKEALKIELTKQVQQSLQAQEGANFFFADNAVFDETYTPTCDQKSGTLADSFNCSGKISQKWLGLDLAGAKNLILGAIGAQKQEGLKVQDESLSFTASSGELDAKQGKMNVEFAAEVKSYQEINQEEFLMKIADRSEKEIRDIAASDYPQMQIMELKFWPFWAWKSPTDTNRIKLEVSFSGQ